MCYLCYDEPCIKYNLGRKLTCVLEKEAVCYLCYDEPCIKYNLGRKLTCVLEKETVCYMCVTCVMMNPV